MNIPGHIEIAVDGLPCQVGCGDHDLLAFRLLCQIVDGRVGHDHGLRDGVFEQVLHPLPADIHLWFQLLYAVQILL